MEPLTISIDETTGRVTMLVNEETVSLIPPDAVIRRASNVEPVSLALRVAFHALRGMFGDAGRIGAFTRSWPILWRVNLAPVGGPILPGCWQDRSEAIRAEIAWLNANYL